MSEPITIFDNGDFGYTAQIERAKWGEQTEFTLKIRSKWEGAKNSKETQVKFFACLEREGLERLGQLIQQQLNTSRDPEAIRKTSRRLMKTTVERIDERLKSGINLSGQETP